MNDALRIAMAEAGETAESLADQVGVDPKTAARWVTPGRVPHPRHRAAVCATLGREVGDLWPDVVRPREPVWFLPWAEVERRADTLRSFEPSVLPGLLQTEAYAHAVLSSGPLAGDEVEGYVAARLARQADVFERPRPPLTVFVIDEAALRRGDQEIMEPQLDHLVAMARRPRVLLHVLPLRAGFHPGQAGAFVLADTDDGEEVAYIDDQAAGRTTKDVAPLRQVWDTLRSVALPRDQTIELLTRRAWLT
ncbi:Scr1 family TA system antitoxin-like transcriptional regulator [Micromonospora sp. NPDC000089]|uniref:Scr1 family TA system antitoxin-like transcriptional regulator n=1 Tax=unclassified Micromonospora TaxID=2617518 RepID=UPI003693AA48